jgi:hypothetical protein
MLSRFGRQRHLSQRVLNEYLDALLPAAVRQGADRHLAVCDTCRQELEGISGVVSLLRQAPQVPLRRSFIFAAPPPAAAKAPMLLRLPNWSYAGAASLAGLVLAVLVSTDALGVPGQIYRDRSSELLIAAPAPLELAPEGIPTPVGDQSVTMKSAEPGEQAPEVGQAAQSWDTPLASPPQPGPGATSVPSVASSPAIPAAATANISEGTETVVADEAQGEMIRVQETFGHPPPGPTPWFWRALEGLAAVAAVGFLLGLLLKVRQARR